MISIYFRNPWIIWLMFSNSSSLSVSALNAINLLMTSPNSSTFLYPLYSFSLGYPMLSLMESLNLSIFSVCAKSELINSSWVTKLFLISSISSTAATLDIEMDIIDSDVGYDYADLPIDRVGHLIAMLPFPFWNWSPASRGLSLAPQDSLA